MTYKDAIAPVCISQKWWTPQTCQFVPEDPQDKILNSDSAKACFITFPLSFVFVAQLIPAIRFCLHTGWYVYSVWGTLSIMNEWTSTRHRIIKDCVTKFKNLSSEFFSFEIFLSKSKICIFNFIRPHSVSHTYPLPAGNSLSVRLQFLIQFKVCPLHWPALKENEEIKIPLPVSRSLHGGS